MSEALFLWLIDQIQRMIRLLFIPLFALVLISCEETSKEIDPLFYQISKVDSIRCMDEILDGIIEEARIEQEFQDSIYRLFYNPHLIICGIREVFDVGLNSAGQLMVRHDIDSVELVEETYHYFMFNRQLSSEETAKFPMDPSYEGFDAPFYNRFSLKEIERRIEDELANIHEMKNTEGTDSALIEYSYSKVEEWRSRKMAMEVLGSKELVELSSQANLRFEYQEETEQSRFVLQQIAYAFYQMRNYECLLHFDETYLSLYERYRRLGRKLDQDKLAALIVIRPAKIVCVDRSNPLSYFVEPEPELAY